MMKDRMTSVLARADSPDIAGNVFTAEALENAVRKANDSGRVGQMMVTLDYGKDVDSIVGYVRNLEYQGGTMSCDTKLINSPKGEHLQRISAAMESKGLSMGVSGKIIDAHDEWRPHSLWRRLWLWVTLRHKQIRKVRIIDAAEIEGISILTQKSPC